MDTDPLLTPVGDKQISAIVKRHRVWVHGVKGLKFSMSIQGVPVLVAKRRQKMALKTWLMSRSSNFSLDSPDLAGYVVRQRTKSSFSIMSPRERRADGFREALAAIRVASPKSIVIGKDLWISPDIDDVFQVSLTAENSYRLVEKTHSFGVTSVKNGAFGPADGASVCFTAAKQTDGDVSVTAGAPLCLVQAFGLAIALFVQ
jgi:hypothetical protein